MWTCIVHGSQQGLHPSRFGDQSRLHTKRGGGMGVSRTAQIIPLFRGRNRMLKDETPHLWPWRQLLLLTMHFLRGLKPEVVGDETRKPNTHQKTEHPSGATVATPGLTGIHPQGVRPGLATICSTISSARVGIHGIHHKISPSRRGKLQLSRLGCSRPARS